MKTSKEMMMDSFNKAIRDCYTMIEADSKTNAAFFRGVAQGLATAMFFSETITHAEYTELCNVICNTIKQGV